VLALTEVTADRIPDSLDRLRERAAARRVSSGYEDPATAQTEASAAVERSAEALRFYDVVEGDRTVGWAAWWHRGDQCELNDVVLDDPGRSAELLPALVALARQDGCPSLGVATAPDEPARDALVELDGFVRRATNMALPLDAEIPDPGGLVLDPMSQAEFDDYLTGSTEEYIGELRAAGMSEASARKQGEEQMAELVPDGLASEGMSFFTARVDGTAVGTLWLSTQRPMAFVYDIKVDESQRRKGYGAATMNAAARFCRDLGHPALGLNVFGHNPNARALYDKLGYHVTRDFRTYDVTDGT
jgi:GNAT superfamily N-acetyltransferase